jgi:hypothetical protein
MLTYIDAMNDKAEREREMYEKAKSGDLKNTPRSSRSSVGNRVKIENTPSGGKHTHVDMRGATSEELKKIAGSFSHLDVRVK